MIGPARRLPTFLVLGTNKAGTSTLYGVLKQHPQIFLPHRKELHFFNNDLNYVNGVDWYVRSFFRGADAFAASGDITPAYLYWGERVVPRIAAAYGEYPPRMVVILRDPVARAYSRYWHQRRVEGREPLSFDAALAAEPQRLIEDADSLGVRGRFARAYVRGGLYGEQLERFFDIFPRDRFHVILFQDLQRDFDGTIRGLLEFLGVDPTVTITPVHRNPASAMRSPRLNAWLRSRSTVGCFAKRVLSGRMLSRVRKALRRPFLTPSTYPPMNPETEQMLRRRYLPDIRKLEALIGRDLAEWYPSTERPPAT